MWRGAMLQAWLTLKRLIHLVTQLDLPKAIVSSGKTVATLSTLVQVILGKVVKFLD